MKADGWVDVFFEPEASAGWALQCSHLVAASALNDYFGLAQSLAGRDEVKSPMPARMMKVMQRRWLPEEACG